VAERTGEFVKIPSYRPKTCIELLSQATTVIPLPKRQGPRPNPPVQPKKSLPAFLPTATGSIKPHRGGACGCWGGGIASFDRNWAALPLRTPQPRRTLKIGAADTGSGWGGWLALPLSAMRPSDGILRRAMGKTATPPFALPAIAVTAVRGGRS
jgi:hypothetical protein